MPDDYSDRRQFQRVPYRQEIQYHVVGLDGNHTGVMLDISSNISEGGLCLLMNEEHDKNTMLTLKIPVTNGEVIHVWGIAVWQSPQQDDGATVYNTGIQFVAIGDEEKEKLSAFIALLTGGRDTENRLQF